MTKAEAVAKRGRGRPQIRSDEATRQLIAAAANLEFLANGYSGTGMEAVARRAGVSTKTLYRLNPTKAALFESVITARVDRFALSVSANLMGQAELTQSLEVLLIECARLTLDEEVIAILRLVIAERARFPEIASAFYEKGMKRTAAALRAWIDEQLRCGQISVESPQLAAGMLLGMMISEPQRAALLGQLSPLGEEAVRERAKACARLFLQGCQIEPH